MNFKTTLFMLLLGAAVGALVYYGSKGPGTEDLKKTPDFWDPKSPGDSMTRIELKHDDVSLVLEKDDKAKSWNITAPFKEAASSSDVDRLKSAIDFLKPEQTFEPNDPKIDKKAWGLDPPKATIAFKSGEATHTLKIGSLTVNKKQGYLQRDDDPKVYVVGCELYNSCAEKKASDFRDKALAKFDTFAVDRLTITMAGQDVEMAYQDGAWKVVRPVADKADAEVVNEVLRVLHDMQAKDFVEDGAKEMKKYGLDVPSLKVSVVPRGEPAAQVLLFGGPREGDKTKVHARRENSDNVVAVEANDVEKLKRTLDDLRDKKVWDFDEHEIVKVTIARPATSAPRIGGRLVDAVYRAIGHVRRDPVVVLEKLGDSWVLQEPAAYPFDILSVTPWLEELKTTRVVEFRDGESPDGAPYWRGANADLTIVLERRPYGTSVNQRMAFPLIALDANKTVTWRPSDARVLAIGSNLIERCRRGAVLFRRKTLLDVRPEQVSHLAIAYADSKVEADAQPGPPRTWKLLGEGTIDQAAIGDVVRRMGTLVAKDFLADDAEGLARHPIAKPTLTVSITFASEMAENEQGPRNDQTATLTVGEKGDNGYTARLEQEGGERTPVAFVLDEATVNDLSKRVLK